MHMPKWFKTDRDLMVGDLVYFIKKEIALGESMWTMCMVETGQDGGQDSGQDGGQDGFIREAVIKLYNLSEQVLSLDKDNTRPNLNYLRYTERSLRILIKMFSVERRAWPRTWPRR